jgi:glycerophosphoryl diester phosphodiesterase
MVIISHRGSGPAVLENTVDAFEKQLQSGIKTIEFDVQTTLDHQPVVFHDLTLWRLARLPIPVSLMTWTQLQKVRLRQGDVSGSISHLSEVLDFFHQHQLKPIIDVKFITYNTPALIELGRVLKFYPNMDITVNSFSDTALRFARKQGFQTLKNVWQHRLGRVWFPLHEPRSLDTYKEMTGMIVDFGLNDRLFEFAQRYNLKIVVGSNQAVTAEKMHHWREKNVWGLIANEPKVVQNFLVT